MNIDLLLYITLGLIMILIIADLICLKWLIISVMMDLEEWEENKIERDKLNENNKKDSGF